MTHICRDTDLSIFGYLRSLQTAQISSTTDSSATEMARRGASSRDHGSVTQARIPATLPSGPDCSTFPATDPLVDRSAEAGMLVTGASQ